MALHEKASYPESIHNFDANVVNNKTVIQDYHINDLRLEVVAIERFLGLGVGYRSLGGTAWNKNVPAPGASFGDPSDPAGGPLKARLDWLDDGLIQHHHDDRYVLLRGSSTIQHDPQSWGLRIKNLDSTVPTLQIMNSSDVMTASINGYTGAFTGKSMTLDGDPTRGSLNLVTLTGRGAGPLISFNSTNQSANPQQVSTIRPDGGFYTGLGSEQAWLRKTSGMPYLNLPMDANGTAIQINGSRTDGNLLQGVSSAGFSTTLTNHGGLILRMGTSSVTAGQDGPLLRLADSTGATQKILFSSGGVDSAEIASNSPAGGVLGGVLSITARDIYLNGNVHMNTGVGPGPVNGSPAHAYLDVGYVSADHGDWDDGPIWSDGFTGFDTHNGADDAEHCTSRHWSGLNNANTIGASRLYVFFIAPSSGEAMIYLTADVGVKNSSAGLSFQVMQNNSVHTRQDGTRYIPSYNRGARCRNFTSHIKESFPAELSDNRKMRDYHTLSVAQPIRNLTPGAEYRVDAAGAYCTNLRAHTFGEFEHLRLSVIPVIR